MDEPSTTQRTLDMLKREWQGETIAEVVEWVRAHKTCNGHPAVDAFAWADAIEAHFAPERRREPS